MFDMTTSASVEALAVAASILASGAALVVIALHMVRTDVDPLTDGVSAYAITPFGYLYRIQVVATGVATLTLTLALLAGGLASGIGVVSLALFAASRILIARYPTDPRGTTHFSRSGRAHVLLAAITFVTMAVAAPSISGALTTNPEWAGPTSLLTGLGWATTILALGTFAAGTTPTTRRAFGVVERGAYVAMLAWLVLTAVAISGGV